VPKKITLGNTTSNDSLPLRGFAASAMADRLATRYQQA